MPGRLFLCATPIGNLDDVSPRLMDTLRSADVIFAEDTRRARTLIAGHGVEAPLVSYFAGNEAGRADELERRLGDDESVALVTDAGTPAISDPGVSAVAIAQRVGAVVSVIPGPSAATAALAASGLPSERFVFEGFLPRKGSGRAERLAHLAEETRTMVLFSATSRVLDDLADLSEVLGDDRPVSVSRELTKLHEEVWWGSLSDAIEHWTETAPRGEFTLVVGGRPHVEPGMGHAIAEVQARTAAGEPMSDAVRAVAENLSIRRRALYQAVLDAQSAGRPKDPADSPNG